MVDSTAMSRGDLTTVAYDKSVGTWRRGVTGRGEGLLLTAGFALGDDSSFAFLGLDKDGREESELDRCYAGCMIS